MNRSASCSPLRKKPRFSSPIYDAQFADLDSDDFQVLDDIEAKLSQGNDGCTSTRTQKPTHLRALEEPNHSNILIRQRDIEPTDSSSSNPSSPRGKLAPTALLYLEDRFAPNGSFNDELISTLSPRLGPSHMLSSPAGGLESCFDASESFKSPDFSPVSNRQSDPATAPYFAFNRASGKAWAPLSSTALEVAKQKLDLWEAEIENELSSLVPIADAVTDDQQERVPLKVLDNSTLSIPLNPAARHSSASASDPLPNLNLFKAPEITAALGSGIDNAPDIRQPLKSNDTPTRTDSMQGSSLQVTASTTQAILLPQLSSPQGHSPDVSLASKPTSEITHSTSIGTPTTLKPLGLTPRAHAFTRSKTRPRFVTPFKLGVLPSEHIKQTPLRAPQPQAQILNQLNGEGRSREALRLAGKVNSEDAAGKILNDAGSSKRTTLIDCGRIPQSFTNNELIKMGLDAKLPFNLESVSHFIHYRFNSSGIGAQEINSAPKQPSLGVDTALNKLHACGCKRATKAWVENHWSLVLWKMLGMSCLDPTVVETRWSWDEVMRQLRYRYTRELINGQRPSLRLVTTKDAPASTPIVLCVSDILWTNEYIDANGRLVPAHPELELTDGWYRLRATVDETLARATRNRILRVGRKIACSGARLQSQRKEPLEALEAYESMKLSLFGNSTHLAEWHAKLGFQPMPFVATLRSLSPDGGNIPLMDLFVTHVLPVAYIEYITTKDGQRIREGTRNEREEAQEVYKWNERRVHEATKLRDEMEKKQQLQESYADMLERISRGVFQPNDDESPPDSIEYLAEELEDSEDAASIIRRVSKLEAGWLARSLRERCAAIKAQIDDEIEQRLVSSFPPRYVRNFRVLRVRDARAVRKAATRTAQLTVWDVMALKMTEASSAGSFSVGQRYMITNLVPSQPRAWMGLESGAEVFLTTTRDSKWKIIR